MSLWDLILAPFRPPTLEHPLFGRMTFMNIKYPGQSYWEGTALFRPSGNQIEISVDGDLSGPRPDGQVMYGRIQAKYPDLWPGIEPVLLRAYADWFQPAPPSKGVGRFVLNSISIPHGQDQPGEWDLSYDCLDDPEHIFTVRMQGWDSLGEAMIDG